MSYAELKTKIGTATLGFAPGQKVTEDEVTGVKTREASGYHEAFVWSDTTKAIVAVPSDSMSFLRRDKDATKILVATEARVSEAGVAYTNYFVLPDKKEFL